MKEIIGTYRQYTNLAVPVNMTAEFIYNFNYGTVPFGTQAVPVPIHAQASFLDKIRQSCEFKREIGELHIMKVNTCAAGFALLNLPKGKSLGRSKPATSSYAQALQHTVWDPTISKLC
jgi:hypothetical protein